jgi:hypothetical protein
LIFRVVDQRRQRALRRAGRSSPARGAPAARPPLHALPQCHGAVSLRTAGASASNGVRGTWRGRERRIVEDACTHMAPRPRRPRPAGTPHVRRRRALARLPSPPSLDLHDAACTLHTHACVRVCVAPRVQAVASCICMLGRCSSRISRERRGRPGCRPAAAS